MNEASQTAEPSVEPALPAVEISAPTPVAAAAADSRANAKQQLKLIGAAAALGGLVFGGVVEYFIGNALDSTGLFGPTIENVIDEQVANFSAVQDKLAALERAATDADRSELTRELAALLSQQEQLATRTHTELQDSQQQIETLREEALRAGGASSGFDFRLGAGESVNVGSRENAFALLRYHNGGATVSLNGESKFIRPGDIVEAQAGGSTYRVLFRAYPTREQPRGGFDVVKVGGS